MSLNMMIYSADSGFSLTYYLIGVLLIALIGAWAKTRNLSYVICAAVFGVYLLFVIDKAFFPIHIADGFSGMMGSRPFMSSVNLIPFKLSNPSEMSLILREFALNVALLVPFGFGVSFLVPLNTKNALKLAPIVGSSIELLQLVISLMIGYAYRVIDINDVILNTLGYLIGYGVFRVFAWVYVALTRRFKIKHAGLSDYVYAVARGAHPSP